MEWRRTVTCLIILVSVLALATVVTVSTGFHQRILPKSVIKYLGNITYDNTINLMQARLAEHEKQIRILKDTLATARPITLKEAEDEAKFSAKSKPVPPEETEDEFPDDDDDDDEPTTPKPKVKQKPTAHQKPVSPIPKENAQKMVKLQAKRFNPANEVAATMREVRSILSDAFSDSGFGFDDDDY